MRSNDAFTAVVPQIVVQAARGSAVGRSAKEDGMTDNTGKQPDPNRRSYPRFPVEIEVTYESDHNFFMGFSENLSEGGLFLATAMVKDVGAVLSVRFTVPGADDPIEVPCEVRWVRPFHEGLDAPAGMGLRFVEIAERDAAAIRAFLAARAPIFYDD